MRSEQLLNSLTKRVDDMSAALELVFPVTDKLLDAADRSGKDTEALTDRLTALQQRCNGQDEAIRLLAGTIETMTALMNALRAALGNTNDRGGQ